MLLLQFNMLAALLSITVVNGYYTCKTAGEANRHITDYHTVMLVHD